MIWLLARPDSEAAAQALTTVLNHGRGAGLAIGALGATDQPTEGDTVIVLGGDGTLIQAARRFGCLGVRLLAINLGRLGYVTGFTAEQATEALDALVAGELTEEARLRLSVMHGGEDLGPALNEALITSGTPGRSCTMTLRVDDRPATTLRGDGVLVATPTGSTAYALSAGGPILMPGMQALVIVPVAPHSIRFRPLVVSPSRRLTVTADESAWVVLDGQKRFQLRPGEPVEIHGNAPPVHLLKPKNYDHLATLRSKLHWGEWT